MNVVGLLPGVLKKQDGTLEVLEKAFRLSISITGKSATWTNSTV